MFKNKDSKDASVENDKLVPNDLGLAEDSFTVIKNLAHIEIHAMNQYQITQDKKYLDLKEKAREFRTKLQNRVVPNAKGNQYCINKHLSTISAGSEELISRFIQLKEDNMVDVAAEIHKWTYENFIFLNNLADNAKSLSSA